MILLKGEKIKIMKKIAVLCSGGVDSSVALHYLATQGYAVEAFYLKIWLEDELSYLGSCPWEEDFSYVSQTAKSLGVKVHQAPFQKEYWNSVVTKSIEMIKKGMTPNPDIFCNSMIKFGAFYNFFKNDFDYFATGHYAALKSTTDWTYLMLGNDKVKDQSYFLSGVAHECFNRVVFPLQFFENKAKVREYAEKHSLPSAKRKDSQGICFLGKIPFYDFLAYHCGKKKGLLIEYESNKVVGSHDGFWFFTIGQRQGIGLSGGPWYVVEKNSLENEVYISKKKSEYNDFFVPFQIEVHSINWLIPHYEYPSTESQLRVKLRHGEKMNTMRINFIYQNHDSLIGEILFPDQGIASGQVIVFYSDEGVVLGSGIMQRITKKVKI